MQGIGLYFDIVQVAQTPEICGISIFYIGIISFTIVAISVIAQLWWYIYKIESDYPVIDVKPKHPPCAREITLIVHNKGNKPATFSANMTCDIIPGERQLTRIRQLVNASMIWESSGTDTETINPNQPKVLKVCFINREDRNGDITYTMNFYIRELALIEKIPCAEYREGIISTPRVQLDIIFTADFPIKGKSEWKYDVTYALPALLLSVNSR